MWPQAGPSPSWATLGLGNQEVYRHFGGCYPDAWLTLVWYESGTSHRFFQPRLRLQHARVKQQVAISGVRRNREVCLPRAQINSLCPNEGDGVQMSVECV